MKQAIIGTGDWAKRIKKMGDNKVLLNPRDKAIDLKGFSSVLYCVPSKYFLDVHEKVINYKGIKTCYSAIKGLASNGETPIEILSKKYIDVRFLGGPNIKNGREVINFGGLRLEKIAILKNIYAIGFGMMIKENGINFASEILIAYIEELKRNIEITNSGLYLLSDLIATCLSPESRNRKFGETIKAGKIPKETVEGLYSAKIAIEYGLYKDYFFIQHILGNLIKYKVI